MKGLLFSLFAIGLAGLAAMAATTLFLNTPVRAPIEGAVQLSTRQAPASTPDPRGAPPLSVDAPAPAAGATPAPGTTPAPAPAGATPPASGDAAEDEGPDKDPYEGIAPEELPPDLQYNADSSVSFPTNI